MERGLGVPGLRIDQALQTVGDVDAHPLAVKERTGSGERAKALDWARRGECL